MKGPQLQLTPDKKLLQDIREAFAGLPKAAEVVFDKLAQELGAQVTSTLATSPGPVRKPIKWTSDDQEGAYYYTKGFGRGIPTSRTGATGKGFKSHTETRNDYRLWIFSNSQPGSEYVYGKLHHDLSIAAKYQQGFHRATGYPLAAERVADAVDTFKTRFVAALPDESDLLSRLSTGGSP